MLMLGKSIFVISKQATFYKLLLIALCLFMTIPVFSQGKQANIWYFAVDAGIDFNTGSPPSALLNSQMNISAGGGTGSASIADTNGNLLFYSDGVTIWNKNHVIMQNGQTMGCYSTQGAMIVPQPGNENFYYFFNFRWETNTWQHYFQYSIIDMTLDNGNGGVVEDKKGVLLFTNSTWHLSAVMHTNGQDIWVLAHNYGDYYYSYLVTADSLNHTPVISQSGSIFDSQNGYMKISPNGKKVASAIYNSPSYDFLNVVDFDNETGIVSDNNLVHKLGAYYGVEFSPDNTKLYTKGVSKMAQYNLEAGTPQDILDSEVLLIDWGTANGALQLGPDGKIYCVTASGNSSYYLSTVHKPNELGLSCDFERDAVYLGGRFTNEGLPSFIQSYLNDPIFTTQNHCLGDTTTFEIDNTNGIDSVYWDFDDFQNFPNDTSTLFAPTYTFSHAGTFDVSLTVYSGLLEKTVIQQVVIHPIPQPEIGNDTLMCDTLFSLDLDATCNATTYFWSTWQSTAQITVSDTGTYFVKATNETGCVGNDTIHIGLTPQPQLDETNLIITPSGCGMANGSITGILVTGSPPLQFLWTNSNGDTIGNTLNISGLSSDIYTLLFSDGNGCNHMINLYTVPDNGSLVIDSVLFTHDHCNSLIAEINIFTSSTGQISYSIYGDSAWVQNGGVFTGLQPGSYIIMIKDQFNCIGIYDNNPVIIQNIGGPEVTSVDITPDINNQSTGGINITTTAPGDISYSITGGSNPQLNNGLFTNLSAGLYNCVVEDAFGCDTIFTAYVPINNTDTLLAINGFGNSCEGETVVIPIKLFNFKDVYSFDVTLNYDVNIVSCDGYLNINPILENGFSAIVTTNTGEIQLLWQGLQPQTIRDNTTMCELVFRGLGEGISPVNWESEPGESAFYDINHNPIDASYFKGEVQVYSNPKITSQPQQEICSGDSIIIIPIIDGGNGNIEYNWSGPDGYTSTDQQVIIPLAKTVESGSYSLYVEDSMQCNNTSSYEVMVIPSPEIAFSEYDTLWMEPGDILEAGDNTSYYYIWNTGSTATEIIIDTIGFYSVEVTTPQNCSSGKSVMVLWNSIPFYIPNAFTPNGDGLNDTFGAIPKYDYINHYHISIFNRWGQQIFETSDITNGWDGTYQGTSCMQGTYVYRIAYEEFGQQRTTSKVFEGTVMLVR